MGGSDRASRSDRQPGRSDHTVGRFTPGEAGQRQVATIAPLFGFVQFEMAGSLPIDDGRYLIRSGAGERVLVTETEGALPPPRRRRRRPRKATVADAPLEVSVAVVTVIRAEEPFGSETAAEEWLRQLDDSDFTGGLIDDAISALDRVIAADAAASGIPFGTPTRIESLVRAKVGYGEGEQVASGRYLEALDVDARGGTGSSRRKRLAQTAPIARTAAILGGRENPLACELLVPRIRLDLDTGAGPAACLAIAPAAASTVSEMEFALEDESHEQDLDLLEELIPSLHEISERAIEGNSSAADLPRVEEALAIAERIIRRRRVLDQ